MTNYQRISEYKKEIQLLKKEKEEILNSVSWKITSPFRVCCNFLRNYINIEFWYNVLKFCKKNGLKATLFRLRYSLPINDNYQKVRNRFIFSRKDLKQQKQFVFSRDITISIIVSLYNTPKNFLNDMISSVQNQTYSKWELCLADGSDEQHHYIGDICKKKRSNDFRIKYTKLEKNLGISENTNAAIKLSSGEYLALLDHDDILHPSALFEVMKAICDGDADFIYTDEATFKNRPKDASIL